MDPDSLAFTLVSDYLNKFGYENVSQKLEKKVNYEKVDTKLDLQTVIKSLKLGNVADTEKPEVPKVTEKPPKNPKRKRNDESGTVSKKPKLIPKEFDDKDLNKLMPIKDVFADKVDKIQDLEKDSC